MLELGVKFLLAYFIGSIMGAMLVGALRGGVDIRTIGSGNPGGTNALRTQGWLFAVGVIVIDVGKGAIGAGIVPTLPLVAEDPAVPRDLLIYSCAAATVVGHVWPIWHRFRGGKGAATVIGTLAVLSPILLVPVLLTWVLFVTTIGYVGLATMAAGVAAPIYVAATGLAGSQSLFYYTLFCALFMIYTHRSNIQRMRSGTESRTTKLMLIGRGRTQ